MQKPVAMRPAGYFYVLRTYRTVLGKREQVFLMVVVEFIFGLIQRLLLTLNLFFFGFLTMFLLLFNRVFFVVRERTRRRRGRIGLLGYGGCACHRGRDGCR